MSSGTFKATLFETAKQSPASLIPPSIGTGNIGVCLSGGGSRAFSAGIGQLRALETIQHNGASLLSQVSILSTVSGGGWIGIPFVYLPSSFTDANFLGTYVPPNGLTVAGLLATPTGIGAEVTWGFSVAAIALSALSLHLTDGVPWNMAWQTVMGLTFLQPFGLFQPAPHDAPTSLFSYNAASLSEYVTGPNPSLSATPTSLVAQSATQRRPYLVALASLAVSTPKQPNGLLVPVQSTPILTGVLSTPPNASDSNGRAVGGGGIPSFAFNSAPVAANADTATVQQTRQWSLTDILGTSSAAYSEVLIQHFNSWKKWPVQFAAELRTHKTEVLQKLSRLNNDVSRHAATLDMMDPMMGGLATAGMTTAEAMASLPTGPLELDPFYQYWSPANPPAGEPVNSSFFADGGNLENTGVASMLSYSNITSIISFINVETPLSQGTGNSINLDGSLPPLFGFQPYADSVPNGYAPYSSGSTDPMQINQIFPSSAFADLQQGLWKASGSGKHAGAAIYEQQLTTLANPWFGVPAGQQVKVLWVYLNYASNWYQSITDVLVKGAVDLDVTLFHFPNYSTLKTDLTSLQVHLLSNFASWCVQDPSNVASFTKMF